MMEEKDQLKSGGHGKPGHCLQCDERLAAAHIAKLENDVTLVTKLVHKHDVKCKKCEHSTTFSPELKLVLRLRGGKQFPKLSKGSKVANCGKNCKVVSESESKLIGTKQTFTQLTKCEKCSHVSHDELISWFIMLENELFDKDCNITEIVIPKVHVANYVQTEYTDIKFVVDS